MISATAKPLLAIWHRAKTILAMSRSDSKASDFVRPGHINPLLAKDGGVLRRTGHTEATVAHETHDGALWASQRRPDRSGESESHRGEAVGDQQPQR